MASAANSSDTKYAHTHVFGGCHFLAHPLAPSCRAAAMASSPMPSKASAVAFIEGKMLQQLRRIKVSEYLSNSSPARQIPTHTRTNHCWHAGGTSSKSSCRI